MGPRQGTCRLALEHPGLLCRPAEGGSANWGWQPWPDLHEARTEFGAGHSDFRPSGSLASGVVAAYDANGTLLWRFEPLLTDGKRFNNILALADLSFVLAGYRDAGNACTADWCDAKKACQHAPLKVGGCG